MANVTIKWNADWEKNLQKQVMESPQFKKIQKDVNLKAQAVVREVDDRMRGGDAEAILAELVEQVKALGVEPNVENLRGYAEHIANGTLT